MIQIGLVRSNFGANDNNEQQDSMKLELDEEIIDSQSF